MRNAGASEEEKLLPYSTGLRRDQTGFLKQLANGSAWLRAAIDAARLREASTSPSERKVLLGRELRNVRSEYARVAEGGVSAYERCERLEAEIKRKQTELDQRTTLQSPETAAADPRVAELTEEVEGLQREYAVQDRITDGFEERLRELEARARTIEDELLQAEKARDGDTGPQ